MSAATAAAAAVSVSVAVSASVSAAAAAAAAAGSGSGSGSAAAAARPYLRPRTLRAQRSVLPCYLDQRWYQRWAIAERPHWPVGKMARTVRMMRRRVKLKTEAKPEA